MKWDAYDAWNAAIAAECFGSHVAEIPAYVDVDSSVLERCAAAIGVPEGQAEGALVAAVRETLRLDAPGPLSLHSTRLAQWRSRLRTATASRSRGAVVDLPVPPVVALLATSVLAAERMGTNAKFASSAYYPRLAELLGLDKGQSSRVRTAFPVTESYWRALNEYLEAAEGLLGLPTAYALSWRYVGIPQSQALVRSADRDKLPDFFMLFGLAPGSELVAGDLEPLLNAWIGTTPSPVSANLQRLWRGGAARERIAGVVALELSLWDGSAREGSEAITRSQGDLQLTALLRERFGSRSMELSFAARLPRAVETSSLVVRSADGTPLIGVLPAAGGRLRPIPGSRLDEQSLAGAVLDLLDESSGQSVGRRPRRVVPFRRDDLLGVWVETDKVQLADSQLLMVKDEEKLLADVLSLLTTYGTHGDVLSAPGSARGSAIAGVPEGWVMVPEVQVYRVPQDVKRIDLQVLVPLATAQLILAEGLKMPGRIRKWSRLGPPEIRAAVADAEVMSVSLRDLDGEGTLLETWTDSVAAMVIPLAELELDDGDYEVVLSVNGDAVTQQSLRLRSGDTPDLVSWETCEQLGYVLGEDSYSAVSASPVCETTIYVSGAHTFGSRSGSGQKRPVAGSPTWATTAGASSVERPRIVLGAADSSSCLVTGAHRIQLPIWHGGASGATTITGICETCGVKKTHPARPKWKGRATAATSSQQSVSFVSPERRVALGVGWDPCLDALAHVGGGSIAALERVASHADASSLFADEFVRTLEALAHIDVQLDSRMSATSWEASSSFLAETTRNGYALTGMWPESARRRLEIAVSKSGGQLASRQAQPGELTSWFVQGLDDDGLRKVVLGADLDAEVVANAASSMVDALPPLSEVERSMRTEPIPAHTKAQWFDLAAARWVPVPGVGQPGAYRVEQSFRTKSIWVSRHGAVHRTAVVGSVQMVKHLAALDAATPLLAYAPGSSVLVVPMGADLPGLYGRAAALCSGLPPIKSPRTRSLAYRDVPSDFAARLARLLAT